MKLALAAVLAAIPVIAFAKPLPRYGTLIYSNLCWEKDSGDAAGTRLELSRTRHGARLTLEYGNGPLENARIKSLGIDGDKFEAQASTADGEPSLSAILGTRSATLSSVFDFEKDQPPKPDRLKRIKRFNQKIPDCR